MWLLDEPYKFGAEEMWFAFYLKNITVCNSI
jgi:hypothetical protein